MPSEAKRATARSRNAVRAKTCKAELPTSHDLRRNGAGQIARDILAERFHRAQSEVIEAADAYRAAIDTVSDRIAPSRRWWKAWEELLKLYNSRANWPGLGMGGPIAFLSPDLMGKLADVCGYLAVGQVPLQVSDARARGRTTPAPDERRDIEIAVAYIAAAKTRLIDDPTPVKTVSIAYGVNRRTVQGWQKDYPASAESSPNIPPEMLPSRMRKLGQFYRASGRSHTAIASRSHKKQ